MDKHPSLAFSIAALHLIPEKYLAKSLAQKKTKQNPEKVVLLQTMESLLRF